MEPVDGAVALHRSNGSIPAVTLGDRPTTRGLVDAVVYTGNEGSIDAELQTLMTHKPFHVVSSVDRVKVIIEYILRQINELADSRSQSRHIFLLCDITCILEENDEILQNDTSLKEGHQLGRALPSNPTVWKSLFLTCGHATPSFLSAYNTMRGQYY